MVRIVLRKQNSGCNVSLYIVFLIKEIWHPRNGKKKAVGHKLKLNSVQVFISAAWCKIWQAADFFMELRG